jgi:hypothetical protein
VARPYAVPHGDAYYGDLASPPVQLVTVPAQVRRQSLANGRLLVGQVQGAPPAYTESELHHHHHHHHIHAQQQRNMAMWNNAAFQQVTSAHQPQRPPLWLRPVAQMHCLKSAQQGGEPPRLHAAAPRMAPHAALICRR